MGERGKNKKRERERKEKFLLPVFAIGEARKKKNAIPFHFIFWGLFVVVHCRHDRPLTSHWQTQTKSVGNTRTRTPTKALTKAKN